MHSLQKKNFASVKEGKAPYMGESLKNKRTDWRDWTDFGGSRSD